MNERRRAVRIDVVTIFPKMVRGPLEEGIVGRAIARGLLDVRVHDLRDHTTDRHRVVDDVPFGGGPGMVLKPEPLFRAVDAIRAGGEPSAIVLTSPDGRRFSHEDAARLSRLPHVVVLCGRYEGVDERVRLGLATEELSIGDYVLSGGELPALVIVDAVARFVPGVVGDEDSVARDTFARGLAGLRAVHAPRGFPRHGRAAGAPVGASRRDRAVAAARGAAADARTASGSDAAIFRSTRRIAGCCRNCWNKVRREHRNDCR